MSALEKFVRDLAMEPCAFSDGREVTRLHTQMCLSCQASRALAKHREEIEYNREAGKPTPTGPK